ncbi:hypothetical protein JCM19239_5758 [Vibrio variabilis]|uniref:Uncharacterized protein n=1 Tax=Vibrio variabilis TaxID=990271 RepID=A0ABQ0JIK9_9VIBR|nr:hypothetical protein JCM19239_5758 [Vibrio variabilis]
MDMNNSYRSALFFVAETAIEPMRKAPLSERPDVYHRSRCMH